MRELNPTNMAWFIENVRHQIHELTDGTIYIEDLSDFVDLNAEFVAGTTARQTARKILGKAVMPEGGI